MLGRRTFVLGLLGLSSSGAVAWAQQAWRRYDNERYGFSIEYPTQFRSDPPPENGDGLHFRAPDGAEFTASAILNMADDGGPQSLAQYEQSLRQDSDDYAHVTYRAAAGDTLILSGLRGNRIFYEKHVLSAKGALASSFDMTYPVALKAAYDPIVARMAQSFRPGTLDDGSE